MWRASVSGRRCPVCFYLVGLGGVREWQASVARTSRRASFAMRSMVPKPARNSGNRWLPGWFAENLLLPSARAGASIWAV